MTIYSHNDIKPNLLNKKFETTSDSNEVCEYSLDYPDELVINMQYIGIDKTKANKYGWKRDSKYYFKELLKSNTDIFSDENKMRINDDKSPYCDQIYINKFPQFSKFKGQPLIHHHIGKDGQAAALPSGLHKGNGVVHNSELEIGITENGYLFSMAAQNNSKQGIEFSWDDAPQIMQNIIEEKLCNNDGKNAQNKNLGQKVADENKSSDANENSYIDINEYEGNIKIDEKKPFTNLGKIGFGIYITVKFLFEANDASGGMIFNAVKIILSEIKDNVLNIAARNMDATDSDLLNDNAIIDGNLNWESNKSGNVVTDVNIDEEWVPINTTSKENSFDKSKMKEKSISREAGVYGASTEEKYAKLEKINEQGNLEKCRKSSQMNINRGIDTEDDSEIIEICKEIKKRES